VGLVERDGESRRYRLGWAVFSLAARVADGRLLSAAGPPMRALSASLGETVHLCVLSGDELLTIRSETPGHGYRAGWIGSRVALHNTSAGRALLVDVSPAELHRRFAATTFAAGGPRARVTDIATLVDAAAEARRLGYAAVDEEFEAGVAGVSAPIRDFSGAIVAALNVSAPAERLRPHLVEAAEATRDAAESISRDLGWVGRMSARLSGPS
ncbi:MAG TPA: IclR family transcriptional regulator, partial [Candidatus Dormibacteraeota bacterium]|nr:IclR family transcriptional regulator [Candidatus Dormibacteraeota bacterium]